MSLKGQQGISTSAAIGIVVAVLIIVGLIYFSARPSEAPGEPAPSASMSDQTGEETEGEFNLPPATSFPIDVGEEEQLENEILNLLFSNEATEVAVLVAVDGSESSGSGYRLIQNGLLSHAVVATMPGPAEGNVYEGWLVQPDPLKFISTGVMQNPEMGVWVLEFESPGKYPSYSRVVITEEAVVDATPERHVIEGDFIEI